MAERKPIRWLARVAGRFSLGGSAGGCIAWWWSVVRRRRRRRSGIDSAYTSQTC